MKIIVLNLINKIKIKSVENINDNKEKIQIVDDNLNNILPNSTKLISKFLPNINKEYLFKINDNNELVIDNLEDGEYRIIDHSNNIFDLIFVNNKSKKPNSINIRNKVFIYGKKINDYKIIDKNDLYPLIIKSIQDLDNKFNNILDDVNNITDKNTLELKNKFDDNLSFSNIINNLSSTYQKLLNDNNNLQKK